MDLILNLWNKELLLNMYDVIEIIKKKRDNFKLSKDEIKFLIEGYVKNEIPDYQISSFLMAAFINGLSKEETIELTKLMINSGEKFSFSFDKPIVDKHSTGGVGDKVSFILSPLFAELGFINPMMAGRGLGHTGGTIDKLESFAGYNPEMEQNKVNQILNDIGNVIFSQSENIVPADKRLYALRDATGTVESIPLISASIVSKKVAEGIDAIVYDVKCGNGAFMKSLDDAEELASRLTEISYGLGLKAKAVITDMNQVLGYSAGNAIEILEVLDFMKNKEKAADLREVTYTLAYELTSLYRKESKEEFFNYCDRLVETGKLYERFKKMVLASGVSEEEFNRIEEGGFIDKTAPIKADCNGYISKMDSYAIGKSLIYLGGGRLKKEDKIDHNVGIKFLKKCGDKVKKGETIALVYFNNNDKKEYAFPIIKNAIKIGDTVEKKTSIYKVI